MRAAGRHAEALDVLRRAVALQPTYGPTLERMERELAATGDADGAADFRLARLRAAGDRARVKQLEDDIEHGGAAESRRRDLRREVAQLLAEAERRDPFENLPTAQSIGDRIALAYSDLGEWANAVEWIERAFVQRPSRLRRLVMDMPFDRQGLASDRRYARLLRVAGLDDLI